MRRHLENLKQKPEHVRHRVALGTAAGMTALTAVIWFGALAASGKLALSPSETGDNADLDLAEARTGFESLVGAVGEAGNALSGTPGAAQSDGPALVIVDGGTTSTITPSPRQDAGTATVIPF
jgi:hypothetical protein